MKNNKVLKAGIGYTIGNFLIKGITLLTLPIFTRLLSTTDYGLFNTYISYVSVVTIIIGLGFYGTIKNAKYDFRDNLHKYMSSVFFISLLALISLLIIFNLFFQQIENLVPFDQAVINILILQSFGSALIQIVSIRYTLDFDYKKYLTISFITTFANVVISIALISIIFDTNKFYGLVLGSAIPVILTGFILFFLVMRQGKFLVSKEMYSYGIKLGTPLISHSLSQVVLAQFDRIMILNLVNAAAAGIYSFTYNIALILKIIYMSFDSVWSAWFFAKMDQEEYSEIQEKSNYYISFFSIITIFLLMTSQELIKLLAPPSYWGGIQLASPLLLSVFFLFIYSLPAGIEFYFKQTKLIAKSTVVAALLNILLNYIFIQMFGYVAAAYTTLVTYILLAVLHWHISKKICSLKIFDISHFVIMSLSVISSAVITSLLNNYILLKYVILICILIVFVIKYKFEISRLIMKKR